MSIISINDQEVANRLEEVMKENRVKSVRAFALSINVDPSYFSKVTKCERSITETMVDAIHEKYNINPGWLLWGREPKFGHIGPQKSPNSFESKPIEADTGTKYIALLEKTLQEKEADLQALRSAVTKITSTDKRVDKLEITVNDLQDRFSSFEPMILGLREFVTEEIAGLKKISREAAVAALGNKEEGHRKKV